MSAGGGDCDQPAVAPSWMSAPFGAADDDDFAQPIPVSDKSAVPKEPAVGSEPPGEPSEEKGAARERQPAKSSLPPWAKPYKAVVVEPTGEEAGSGKRRSSLGGGMPAWAPKPTISATTPSSKTDAQEKERFVFQAKYHMTGKRA